MSLGNSKGNLGTRNQLMVYQVLDFVIIVEFPQHGKEPIGYFVQWKHGPMDAFNRDSSNARVTELETRIATLEKELAIARKEAATALTRAKEAESKEQAIAKQEEELVPRVEALVNSLSGKVHSFDSCPIS